MKYHLISKKTMRNKDFASLKEKKAGYLQFKASRENAEHRYESLFRTPRGWFMLFFEISEDWKGRVNNEKIIGEVSVTTAQKWLDECGMNYNAGW